MKVWNVKFTTDIHNLADVEDLEQMEINDDERHLERIEFQICAEDYEEANIVGINMIRDMINLDDEEDNSEFDIQGVDCIDNINISNWGIELPSEHEQYCPYHAANHCADEDLMKFNCSECNEEIVVADNGWEHIHCSNNNCDNVILRSEVKEINGKWTFVGRGTTS